MTVHAAKKLEQLLFFLEKGKQKHQSPLTLYCEYIIIVIKEHEKITCLINCAMEKAFSINYPISNKLTLS